MHTSVAHTAHLPLLVCLHETKHKVDNCTPQDGKAKECRATVQRKDAQCPAILVIGPPVSQRADCEKGRDSHGIKIDVAAFLSANFQCTGHVNDARVCNAEECNDGKDCRRNETSAVTRLAVVELSRHKDQQ